MTLYADWHNDLLSRCLESGDDPVATANGQVSIERLVAARYDLVGLSLWWNPGSRWSPAQSIRAQLDMAEQLEADGHLRILRSAGDLSHEGLKVLLHLEGCPCLEDGLSPDEAFSRGVRSLSLTWNEENSFAGGTGLEVDPDRPLKAAGRRLVDWCRDNGVVVDLAHLNDAGVRDLIGHDDGILVATHANCRAVLEHRRNLLDDVIHTIALRQGAVGLTLVPWFLRGEGCPVESVLDHVRHICSLGCEAVLSWGSDFDGTELPDGLTDCRDWASWLSGRDDLPAASRRDNMARVLEAVL